MSRFSGLLLVALGGCATSDLQVVEGLGDHDPSQHMIYGGRTPNAAHHDATVALHQVRRSSVYVQPFCSGTLIRSDVVLTAAHCLDGLRNSLAVYVGDDPSVDILDHLYLAADTDVYSGYNSRSIRGDIALIRLSSPVTETAPVPNLPASEGFTASDIGDSMNFAGFGQTEDGSSGVKLQADLPLGGLGCTVAGCPNGGDAATQVSYSQGNAGPCFGDSGGPMFVQRGNTTYVGGITSYGDSYCEIYGVSTRVDAYQGYIEAFAGAGDPGGDPGDPGACGDGVCGAGESCDGRDGTQACGDCAGKVNGRPDTRYCEVEGVCEGPGC